MFIISSAAAAVLPMMIYLYLIWKFDRYDREPVSLVLRNYLWGALGAIFFSIIGSDILISVVALFTSDPDLLRNIQVILIAPVVEESMKGIFLLLTIAGKKFDNMTDGIVYGGAIGLGFGMTENFLYFITFGDTLQNWIMLVIIRTLFSGVMHGVSTATFGAFLGYAKFKDMWFKIAAGLAGLGLAIFIHFIWNLSVSFDSTAELGFIFLGASLIMMIAVFIVSLAGERKIIFRELAEEANLGVIPFEHLYILNSSRRNKFGWVDEKVRKSYVIAATNLAFRKMQCRNSRGYTKHHCEEEINYYRNYIQELLAKTTLSSNEA